MDQLRYIIDTLKKDPNDRRMVMSAWNPAALAEMALPPCHMFCQVRKTAAAAAVGSAVGERELGVRRNE